MDVEHYLSDLGWERDFSWALFGLVLITIVFCVFQGRESRFSLIFRLLALCLLLIALAGPQLIKTETSKQLSVLVDLSASIPDRGLETMASALKPFVGDTGREITFYFLGKDVKQETIKFGTEPRSSKLYEIFKKQRSEINQGLTNLASAILGASKSSPSRSILMLSDGFDTEGETLQAAELAAKRGASFYPLVLPAKEFETQSLSLVSLNAPLTSFAGKKADVQVSVKNTSDQEREAVIEIRLEGDEVSEHRVIVPPKQQKTVSTTVESNEGGLKRLHASLSNLRSKIDDQYRWISFKEKEKILLLNGKDDDDRVISRLLIAKGYAVESITADGQQALPRDFSNFSLVIMNNARKTQLYSGFLEKLESFVETGGSALLIGGERSFGLGGYRRTALEEISPLSFLPPQTTKKRLSSGVILVIDKSRSMIWQGKIGAAKRATLTAINALKDDDQVGVIGFDATPFVIIRLRPVPEVKKIAAGRLKNLTAAGNTNLLPALAAARQSLRRSQVSRKHIIVLSDGKFPLAGNAYVREIEALRGAGITVSAVALGSEADVPFMKMLSKYGKGAFYQTLDPSKLPEIFVRDIEVTTGEKTLREQDEFPVSKGPSGIRSVSLSRFPALTGFVETRIKKGANLELITRKEGENFPILASWEVSKGRVIAFTSDANGRWSLPWLRWQGFNQFWTDIVKNLTEREEGNEKAVDFDLRYSLERNNLLLDLAVYDPTLGQGSIPAIQGKIKTPNGETKEVKFQHSRRGRFLAMFEGATPGDYFVDLDYGASKLPPVGITLRGKDFGENVGAGINLFRLAKIASTSGGFLNPDPEQLENENKQSQTKEDLRFPLLVAALMILLLEAIVREQTILQLLTIFRRGQKKQKLEQKLKLAA